MAYMTKLAGDSPLPKGKGKAKAFGKVMHKPAAAAMVMKKPVAGGIAHAKHADKKRALGTKLVLGCSKCRGLFAYMYSHTHNDTTQTR